MSRVFISYARESEPVAERVDDRLRALGYEVWRDNKLPAHRPYGEVIEEHLRSADAVVVLWSKAAAASQWVRGEADVARNAGRLVQVRLDDTLPPLPFNQIQCADLRDWDGRSDTAGWRKLVESVATLASLDPGSSAAPSPARAPEAAAPSPRYRRLWIAGVAALAVLLAAAGGWSIFGRGAASGLSADARIAVLPFDTTGSGPEAQKFAAGLFDESLSVLSAHQVNVVSRTESVGLRTPDAAAVRKLGASLLLDGSVEDTGGRLRVRVHLDDAATGSILWSEDFERPAAEATALQAEVASKATTLAAYALLAAKSAKLPEPVLADYLSGVERIRFDWSGGMDSAEPILRRVTKRAPDFAAGHTNLAAALAFGGTFSGMTAAAERRAEAKREAERAIALDPSGGLGAYSVLAGLLPMSDWAARDALFRKSVALDPTVAANPYLQSSDLAYSGRLNAAMAAARRAVVLDPLWPGPTWALGLLQLETGSRGEGLATFDRMAELWPQHAATRSGRLWATAMYGDPDKALALLADEKTAPAAVTPEGIALWRQFLVAMKSGAPSERARVAAALEAGERSGALASGPATAMLARLGDLDGAFAAASDYLKGVDATDFIQAPYMFVTATAPIRRDPRFMPLLARVGLPQFWLASGKWPDFCAEPGLPYDCKVEAAKVSMPAKR